MTMQLGGPAGTRDRRLLAMFATTAGALWIAAGPASALTLTVTLPPAPAPVAPVGAPVSTTVSVGSDPTAPVGVSVSAPIVPPLEVQVPGVTNVQTQPVPLSLPVVGTAPSLPAPGSTVSAPGVGSLPPFGSTAPEAAPAPPPAGSNAAATPASPAPRALGSAAAPAVTANDGAPISHVQAVVTRRAPSGFLAALPSLATRVLAWAALVALGFGLRFFVTSAFAPRRRKPRVA